MAEFDTTEEDLIPAPNAGQAGVGDLEEADSLFDEISEPERSGGPGEEGREPRQRRRGGRRRR